MQRVCTSCNHDDWPLEKAAQKGHIECLKMLLKEASASTTSRAFIKAVQCSRCDSANFLLDAGINVNFHHPNGSDTPLMAATSYDHSYLMNRLIVAGASVNAINDKGQAALHLAKTKECLDLLIHAGVDVNIQDYFGRTPLFCMAEVWRL